MNQEKDYWVIHGDPRIVDGPMSKKDSVDMITKIYQEGGTAHLALDIKFKVSPGQINIAEKK